MSIKAKRIGYKLDPPSIVLEYESGGKLRRRLMPLRNVTITSLASKIIEDLIKKHEAYLSPKVVSNKQLRKIIEKIIDGVDSKKNGASHNKPAHSVSSSTISKPSDNPALKQITEDLNKVSEEELKKVKAQMTEDFEKNRKKPGDAGYKYDKRANFTGAKERSEWDEEEGDEDDDLLIDEDDLIF